MSSTAPRSRPTPDPIEAGAEREDPGGTITQLHSRLGMLARARRKARQRPGVATAAVIATVVVVGLLVRRARR